MLEKMHLLKRNNNGKFVACMNITRCLIDTVKTLPLYIVVFHRKPDVVEKRCFLFVAY